MEYISIKTKMQLSIYQFPPTEAEIKQESERVQHIHKLSSVFFWSFCAVTMAICLAIPILAPDYVVITVVFGPLVGTLAGAFLALNGKDALNNVLKKFKPISDDNFPDEYYELSRLSRKNDEIKAYLISVSKLGRAPIYLEFLMLKDWFEGIPARVRKNSADAVFSDIAAQADASFRDVAGGCESRPTLLR